MTESCHVKFSISDPSLFRLGRTPPSFFHSIPAQPLLLPHLCLLFTYPLPTLSYTFLPSVIFQRVNTHGIIGRGPSSPAVLGSCVHSPVNPQGAGDCAIHPQFGGSVCCACTVERDGRWIGLFLLWQSGNLKLSNPLFSKSFLYFLRSLRVCRSTQHRSEARRGAFNHELMQGLIKCFQHLLPSAGLE